jgi:hypothetical protein
MQEEFLHYIWKYRRFEHSGLHTTDGEPVTIQHPGMHNPNAGPDFTAARLTIGELRWAGDVEIHLRSSDWYRHRHQDDAAYHNIVLHVVYTDDRPALDAQGQRIATVELKGRIPENVILQYDQLRKSRLWVPCAGLIGSVDRFTIDLWLERLLVERMEDRFDRIAGLMAKTGNSWEETFYLLLARHFGMQVNSVPFEVLAASTPLKILAKNKDKLLSLEALLFGQAGMLAQVFRDEYPRKLQQEYDHLRKLHNLQPQPGTAWKFSRLRPANFPTIRIAQFAALVHQSAHLFSRILDTEKPEALRKLFAVEASEYWRNHFRFDKPVPARPRRFGAAATDGVLINVVAPFLFYYGRHMKQENLTQRSLILLEALPAEKNGVITKWEGLIGPIAHAAQSQAALHLKKHYCDDKRCLQCAVGNKLVAI